MSGRGGGKRSSATGDSNGAVASSSNKHKRRHDGQDSGHQKGYHSSTGTNRHKNKKPRRQHHRRPPPYTPTDPATLPRFLDSTGAVTAGTFSARRLPEMKSLWRSFLDTKNAKSDARAAATSAAAVPAAYAAAGVASATTTTAATTTGADRLDDSWNYRSGGRKASDRHLRRRTGSHNRRRRHRFPTGLPNNDDVDNDDNEQSGGTSDAEDKVGANSSSNNYKPPCRRARRKPAVLREAHRGWQRQSSSSSSSSPHTPAVANWIETHLWHTKRFHMSPPIFGWSIPLVHTGRGTAAALRLAGDGCTVQDATWSIDGGAATLSSSSLDDLIAVLGRVCGQQAEFLSDKMVLSGHQWGESTIHEIDSHPLGVIGPARFLFYRRTDRFCVGIFAHLSIRDEIDCLVVDAASFANVEEESKVQVGQINGGVALIHVRGEKAVEAINTALQPNSLSSSVPREAVNRSLEWKEMCKSPRAHRIVPHGTIVPVELNPTLPRRNENNDTNDCRGLPNGDAVGDAEETVLSYVDKLSEVTEDTPLEGIVPASHFDSDSNFSILTSHRPYNIDYQLKHNAAVCGWDILCSPGIACDIFLALNNHGACAIGIAEEARASLESEPPIPIFPRDFPDTQMGESYWSGQDTAWNIVRCCLEQGALGGRVKTELKRIIKSEVQKRDIDKYEDKALPEPDGDSGPKSTVDGAKTTKMTITRYHPFCPMEWRSITLHTTEDGAEDETKDVENTDEGVEVVRGAFGAPFVQALHDSGRFVVAEPREDRSKRRRPRRWVRPPQMAIQAYPLTKEDGIRHKNLCQMLLSSLSLPALLRCHISIVGKGTLEPSAAIYRYTHEVDLLENRVKLGFIVAGAFSNNRGSFHGTAFIGAARLLESLVDNPSGNTVSIMDPTEEEGGRKVALRVLVKSTADGTVPRSATLSLML